MRIDDPIIRAGATSSSGPPRAVAVSSKAEEVPMTEDPTTTLTRLRSSIDNIDASLVYLLAERFKATKQVGRLKAEHGMPASDPAREEQQVARLRRLAEEADLDPAFAEKWFNFVVAEVIRHHTEAADSL
jgi:chorismate mutase